MVSCPKCTKNLEWYLNVYVDDIKSSKVLMLCFTLRVHSKMRDLFFMCRRAATPPPRFSAAMMICPRPFLGHGTH